MAVSRVLLVSWPPAAEVEERASFDVDEYEHVLELGLAPAPVLGRVLADVEAVAVAAAANVAQLVEIAGTKKKDTR